MPSPQETPHARAFVAATLPTELLRAIEVRQGQLERKLEPGQVRWTPTTQIHLTLRFFGNVLRTRTGELFEVLRMAAQGSAPLALSVRGLGCFPSWQRPSVIWMGIEGDIEPLAKLQAQIERHTGDFGSHSEDRAFHPHLTIGRVRSQGAVPRKIGEVLRREPAVEIGSWRVNEIALIQSHLTPQGSIYTNLGVASLGLSDAR